MAGRQPRETRNLDTYGNPPLEWERVRRALEQTVSGESITWFLGVTGPDGTPHAAGVGAVWVDDQAYLVSGPGTRKSRDLARQPAASLSVHLPDLDLVFEGTARRVTDAPTLERLVRVYNATGWPAEVEGDALTGPFSAPSAGPPPWYLYRLELGSVYAVAGAEPHGATRWRF
ncbi:MAG: pyridoxamine 5'-phosphate oxidase family protein [Chloroflexota bacterium]